MADFSTLNTLATTSLYGVGLGFALSLVDNMMPAKGDLSTTSFAKVAVEVLAQSMVNMFAIGVVQDFRGRIGFVSAVPESVTSPVIAAILIGSQPNYMKKIIALHQYMKRGWGGFRMTMPGTVPATRETQEPRGTAGIQTVERGLNTGSDRPVIF